MEGEDDLTEGNPAWEHTWALGGSSRNDLSVKGGVEEGSWEGTDSFVSPPRGFLRSFGSGEEKASEVLAIKTRTYSRRVPAKGP